MEFKVFSAKHLSSGNSYKDVLEIKAKGMDLDIWLVYNFPQKTTPLVTIISKIEKILEGEFFQEEIDDYADRLEEVLRDINEQIKPELAELGEETFLNGGILIALFADDALHFTSCGTPEVYFMRSGSFSTISDGLAGQSASADLFANVASGELKDDDKVVFASSRILRWATGRQITEAVNGGVLESIESLKFIIPDEEDLALVVVHVKSMSPLPFSREPEPSSRGYFANANAEKQQELATPSYHRSAPPRRDVSRSGFYDLKKNINRFLGSGGNPNKKIAFTFTSLIGLVLIASFIGMIAKGDGSANSHECQEKKAALENDLKTAENLSIQGDSQQAEALINSVIEESGALSGENCDARSLGIVARNLLRTINNVEQISGARVVADISEENSNVDLQGILKFQDELYVFDQTTLYKVVGDEVVDTFFLTEDEEIIEAAALETMNSIVFITRSGKVIEFKDNQASPARTTDQAFKKAVDIATFNKYIYLLDSENGEVWKYERNDNSFGAASDYNENAEIVGAKSISIDGSIFILTADNQVIKTDSRMQSDFTLAGDIPEGALDGVDELYVGIDLDELFLLDREGKRIVIFSKGSEGATYKNTIVVEDAEEVRDVYSDPNLDRLFFIDQTRILER
jgi:hypothetical protein